jgi:tRNA nucleotidyltransferase/poly(A) polymerase
VSDQLDAARAALAGRDAWLVGGAVRDRLLGPINYEITCGIGPRVPRAHHRDGEALT